MFLVQFFSFSQTSEAQPVGGRNWGKAVALHCIQIVRDASGMVGNRNGDGAEVENRGVIRSVSDNTDAFSSHSKHTYAVCVAPIYSNTHIY